MIELFPSPDGTGWTARVSRYGTRVEHTFAIYLSAALWASDRWQETEWTEVTV